MKRKLICLLLVIMIIFSSITIPVQEAQAVLPLFAIPLVDVTPGIVAALLTLIAGGLVVHSDDIALSAAKAYQASGEAMGTFADGVVTIGSAAVSAASTWLNSWTSSVVENTSDTYTQPLGETYPQSEVLDWTADIEMTLLNEQPITNLGLNTLEIQGWTGIVDWLKGQTDEWPDDARMAYLTVTGLNWPGYYKLLINRDYLQIEYAGGFVIVNWPNLIDTVEAMRLTLRLVYDEIFMDYTLNIGVQILDSTVNPTWFFPSDAPQVSYVPPDGISVNLKTDTSQPISLDMSIPLTYGPADMVLNPSVPQDYSVPVPADWTGVIDQTIDTIAQPQVPVEDPTIIGYLTDFWDWMAKIWAWIQEFWQWLKSLPGLLMDLLKTALRDLFIPTALTTAAINELNASLMQHAPFAWVGQSFTMLQRITSGLNSNAPPALKLPIIGSIMEFPITVAWIDKIRPLTTFLIWASLLAFAYKQYRSLFGGGGDS